MEGGHGRDLAVSTYLDGWRVGNNDNSCQDQDPSSTTHNQGGLEPGWEGEERFGATCDSTSLSIRLQMEFVKSENEETNQHEEKGETNFTSSSLHLSSWDPNPNPLAKEEFGGRWGKVCGHNEVCLFAVRPFYPIKVLNTRVCSQTLPAPGNKGYHGCLEFLQLQCKHSRRNMTIWEPNHFVFINSEGDTFFYSKREFLKWDQNKIEFFMKNMRDLTIQTMGQISPPILWSMVIWYCAIGIDKIKLGIKSQNASIQFLTNPSNLTHFNQEFDIARLVGPEIISYLIDGNRETWSNILYSSK